MGLALQHLPGEKIEEFPGGFKRVHTRQGIGKTIGKMNGRNPSLGLIDK
jgi:hypothetical protein